MIGLQSFQCRVGGARNRVRRKILRDLALTTAARFAVMNKIVADFCGDSDFLALIRKRFGDQFLAQAVAVGIRGIEKGDAKVEGLVHERDRFTLGKISPPTGRNCPESEADFAHCQVGVLVGAKFHRRRIERSADCRVQSKPTKASASASRLICSSTRTWILWISKSDQSFQ